MRARVRPASVRPKQQRRGGRNDAAATLARRPPAQRRARRAPPAGDRRACRPGCAVATLPLRLLRRRPLLASAAPILHPTTNAAASTWPRRRLRRSTRSRSAAEEFMSGLASAFGFDVTTRTNVEGSEIEVAVDGSSLGLLVGPGGRTLLAIQDLARVAAQRRLGDHETRLRIDVAGYREKRRQALERFATSVAEQVRESGSPRSLDPMPSADRKVIHDVLTSIEGVTSRSEGEEPIPAHRRPPCLSDPGSLGRTWSARRRARRGPGVVAAPRHARGSPDRRGHRSRPCLRDGARRRSRCGARPRQRWRRPRPRHRRRPARSPSRPRRSPGDPHRPPPPARRSPRLARPGGGHHRRRRRARRRALPGRRRRGAAGSVPRWRRSPRPPRWCAPAA